MSESKVTKTIAILRKELVSIESDSHSIVRSFEMLRREAEYLKMYLIIYCLEEQRKSIALQRGLATVFRDKRRLGASLAVAVGSLVLGGLMTRDKYNAINAGLTGFNGVVQGFGETRWAVSLQNKLIVTPCDAIWEKGTWVAFESSIAAIHDIKKEVLQGKRLLTVDNIIQRLKQSKRLIYHPCTRLELNNKMKSVARNGKLSIRG